MGPEEARKAKAAAEKKKREAGSGSWLDKNIGYGVHDIQKGLAKDCIHCVELVKKRRARTAGVPYTAAGEIMRACHSEGAAGRVFPTHCEGREGCTICRQFEVEAVEAHLEHVSRVEQVKEHRLKAKAVLASAMAAGKELEAVKKLQRTYVGERGACFGAGERKRESERESVHCVLCSYRTSTTCVWCVYLCRYCYVYL